MMIFPEDECVIDECREPMSITVGIYPACSRVHHAESIRRGEVFLQRLRETERKRESQMQPVPGFRVEYMPAGPARALENL